MRKRIHRIFSTFHVMFKMEVHELARDDRTCPLFREMCLIINFRLYFSHVVPCWVKNLKVVCSLSQYTNIFDLCTQACTYMHKYIVGFIADGKTEGKVKTLQAVLNLNFKQKNSLICCCRSLKNIIHSSKKKCCASLDIQEILCRKHSIRWWQKEKAFSEQKW